MGRLLFVRAFYARLFVSLFLCSLCPIHAFAEPNAFGEIKANGDARIGSSTGTWRSLHEVYPLLKNTRLKTGQGIVAVSTRESSRLDLSNNTEAEIEVTADSYTVKLSEGTFAFSVAPDSSLTVITKDTDIVIARQVGGYFSLVAGPGAPAYKNVQGMVIKNIKGTYIQSMAGRIQVNGRGLQARVIDSGESLFASAEGTKAGGIGAAMQGEEKDILLKQALITGAFFTSGTIIAIDAFRGDGFKSRSGF